ncbi:type II toxin-antitoxin system PemI/MazE family antitoxin [Enterococcus sp. DIV0187]|uniref:type II toxin-antitoxin system PemI/MazE family antitoxin n=1 Tax=Enterococcus sp. DIV0187 TaxID=2774644 RepID=UPI003F685EB7
MDTVKTRKQGNAVMVTLASKFDVPAGKMYYINQEPDGTISLIPKVEDYFAHVRENEFVDVEDDMAISLEIESRILDE